MTKVIGVLSAATIAAVLSVAPKAHATLTLTWVQQPGQATDIGVASNNMPWIIDTNGVVEYGTPSVTNCSGSVCYQTGEQWHTLAGYCAHVAVNLNNDVFCTDGSRGELWITEGKSTAPSSMSANNWFDWFSQWYGITTYDYAGSGQTCNGQFAVTSGTGLRPDGRDLAWDEASLFAISCANSSVRKLTPGWDETDISQPLSNPIWSSFGVTAQQVVLFSQVFGSNLTQIPWIVSNGRIYRLTAGGFVQVESPEWSTGKVLTVTAATDSFVVANGGLFQWFGGADAAQATGVARSDWGNLIEGTPLAPLWKIAYAGVMPGPNSYGPNAVGPSQLWALDTLGDIYELLYIDVNTSPAK
ncbi:MAG TPA: hypothetical protein VK745_31685 [Polyangiaceae bacterium]|nr:hypothetical protein [Polyangiaceae bacterium]